jgi:RNA polymerase-binding transcription factor DksA
MTEGSDTPRGTDMSGKTDEAWLAGRRAELDDVEVALAALDDGSYGRCQGCGEAIEQDRLAALPATRYCDRHRDLGSSPGPGVPGDQARAG